MKKMANYRFSQVLYKENRCMVQRSMVAAGEKAGGQNLCKGHLKRPLFRDELKLKPEPCSPP